MKQRDYLASGIEEILATDEFWAVPIKVATPESGTVVKAGTPITRDGAVTTGADAYGILVYEVDTAQNENGAVIRYGLMDGNKAQEISGITYDKMALKASLPGIKFREDIGAKGDEDNDVVGFAIVGTAKVREE